MLFQTKDFVNVIFGIVAWMGLIVFCYAMYNLATLE